MEGIWNNGTGISFHGNKINNLRCADEIDQFDEQRKLIQERANTLHRQELRLRINASKTKTMIMRPNREWLNNIRDWSETDA